MKCTNCGNEFETGKFCPECGTRIGEPSAKEKAKAFDAELKQKKADRKGIITLLSGIMSWLGGGSLISYAGAALALGLGFKALGEKTKYRKSTIAGMILAAIFVIGGICYILTPADNAGNGSGTQQNTESEIPEDSEGTESGQKPSEKPSEEQTESITVSGDMDVDIAEGLLYSDSKGHIVDRKGNIIPEYADIEVLENGALSDGENILDGYGVRKDGMIGYDYYYFYDTDSTYYTREVFQEYEYETWCLALSEIYARHGCIFENQDMQYYFNVMVWYEGTVAESEFDTSVFNACERLNVKLLEELIEEYEEEQEELKYLVPLSGQYKSADSPLIFTVSAPLDYEGSTDIFFYVTIYAGVEGNEFAAEYSGMINVLNPGKIVVTMGIQSFAYVDYDAKNGTLSGYGLVQLGYDLGVEDIKEQRYYLVTE